MSTTSTAITGMKAAQESINVASHNIANLETPGFKEGFIDLYNISSNNGVAMLEGNAISLKGSLNYTGIVTDLATSNQSLFIVQNKINNDIVNMVTGSFRANKDGQLESLGKYLLLGQEYNDDGSLPGLDINTLQPIVIDNNILSKASPTTNIKEEFNLNSSLLAKGQASFVMTPNSTSASTTRNLSDPLTPGGALESNNGFSIQVQSEQNGVIKTDIIQCIYISAITSNPYTNNTNSIASSGISTDDIQIEYNGKTISIPRATVAGGNDSTTLQNIATQINSIIGNNQAYVSTASSSSQLIIKPPLDGSDSLFISGVLATSLGITAQISPISSGAIRFTSMQDLKNQLSGYFSEIDSNADSQSLLFIANKNTNVSMVNLDISKDVLAALGMSPGVVPGQSYDPYNNSGNMASGAIVPDIVESVTLYDSKGGPHIANIALKKVPDGWIQEVYISNPYQILGARSDGLMQVTKFILDNTGNYNKPTTIIPNTVMSSLSDPYGAILSPPGAIGVFTVNGVTFTQGTDFTSMMDLVNQINQNVSLQPNFYATIVKNNPGEYNITIISKGREQPNIVTNLFNVTNQEPLPDVSTPLTITFNPQENLQSLNITFDYKNITESAYKDMFGNVTSDGMAPSTLASISIDNTGDVIGTFANGTTKKLYKIPLATYKNIDGLDVLGDNTLGASALSGTMQIDSGGSASIGEVLSGNIESSNIEQAEQLTTLIMNKQFYNMNTKSLQTGNAIIDYLLNSSGF